MLQKDAILAAKDLLVVKVSVPEWGGEVYVRVITAAEKDAYERSWFVGEGEDRRENLANLRARFAVLVTCDESGKRIFADGDAAALGQKSATALDRIWRSGHKLNKMQADAVEAEVKN